MAITLVGSAGAFARVASGSISPAFGQSTTAGHLLVAWVGSTGAGAYTNLTTSASGWVQAVQHKNFSAQAAIWYKPNCGSGETAPTFTVTGSALTMEAQLAEFAGVATTSPVDQIGSGHGSASPFVVTNASTDAKVGSLQATAYMWLISSSSCTTTDTYGSNATAINLGNDDATVSGDHGRFSYAVTTGISVADTDSGTINVAVSEVDAVVASFKPVDHTGISAGVGASSGTLTEKAALTGSSAGAGGSLGILAPLPLAGWASRVSIPNNGVGGGTLYSEAVVLSLL